MSDDLKERLDVMAQFLPEQKSIFAEARARIAELETQRVDLIADLGIMEARANLVQVQLKAAKEALEFYRDAFQFVPRRTKTGIDLSIWKPKDVLLEDCGERARAALDPKPTATGETP